MPSEPSEKMSLKTALQEKFWSVVALLGVVTILGMIAIRLFNHDRGKIGLGDNPEDFVLESFTGDVIDTHDLRGSVLVVNFWASWCTTCDREARLLQEAWDIYQSQARDDVVILGVAYMDTSPSSRSFLAENSVTYPNGPDLRSEISRIYQVTAVPETYFLDAEGTLRAVKIGPFSSADEILAMVEGIIDPDQP